MELRNYISFVILLISCVVNAQTTQKGVVKEYNEKAQKTPLAGVELNVRSAGSAVSDKKGEFALNFLTLKAGDHINVRNIQKAGYEIFNKEALEQWNLNPTSPFIVVMCRSDKFKRIRDNHERRASANYKKQYDKEVAQLQKLKNEGKILEEEYCKRLAEIQDNYDRQLDNLQNYVDRFARIDLSELSSDEQSIIDLVKVGDFDDAIKKYDDMQLEDKYIRSLQNENKLSLAISLLTEEMESQSRSKDDISEMIDRKIKTLLFIGGRDNINEAIGCMKKITSIDSLNVEKLLKTGLLIQENISDFEDAYKYFQKALQVSMNENGENHPLTANALVNIGGYFSSTGNYKKALEYYNRSLEIKETYSPINFIDIANIYNHIGTAHYNMGNHFLAAYFYQKALEMQLELLDEYNFNVASSYNNLGAIFMKISDFEKAFDYFDKSLKIRKSLRGENHETVGESYNNIGWFYDTTNQYDKALESYHKALSIYTNRYGETNLRTATVLNNIGIIYGKVEDYKRAAEFFKKALEIKEGIYGVNHITVAQALQNLGDTYNKLGIYEDAIKCAEKEIHIRQNLPFDDLENLSFAFLRAGDACQKKLENEKARKYFNEALNLRLNLFGEQDRWVKDLRNNKILFPDY